LSGRPRHPVGPHRKLQEERDDQLWLPTVGCGQVLGAESAPCGWKELLDHPADLGQGMMVVSLPLRDEIYQLLHGPVARLAL
jgi:hypothetical protein